MVLVWAFCPASLLLASSYPFKNGLLWGINSVATFLDPRRVRTGKGPLRRLDRYSTVKRSAPGFTTCLSPLPLCGQRGRRNTCRQHSSNPCSYCDFPPLTPATSFSLPPSLTIAILLHVDSVPDFNLEPGLCCLHVINCFMGTLRALRYCCLVSCIFNLFISKILRDPE